MKFSDLEFKERTWELPELACALSGMNVGTEYAYVTFNNNYMLSVVKGSYLCGKNTYEIGILFKGKLCDIVNEPKLHNRLMQIGLKHDKSGQLVYGFVTKTAIEKVAKILEGI